HCWRAARQSPVPTSGGSPIARSTMSATSSALPGRYRYSDILVKPSSVATRSMETAASPWASPIPTVLISGASVAGPALAHWLGRYGFRPTVVEIAPALRGGGRAVDFRGQTHLGVLERMGVLEDLRRVQTGGTVMRFVDERGRKLMELPADFAGGDLEVLRSDLSRVLYEHSRDTTEYLFGDTITAMTETPRGVEVSFPSGAPRPFDLVIGADGVHSNVRRLAFGPESRFISHLGYYVATWTLPNHLALTRRAR